ncbi:MAG: acyl-CoA thioesterase [Alteromonas sp.]|uniref:acyl-CoA thioesterase n=1 Tax=unclassified Alteromonas TaxID=2614992 RepID=UPI0009041635|nr:MULTISPECIES: acyl-CoA thioesterase [unclassified Alteromonas]APE06419.1 acyl-CoA thioesterase [Alteromonas sp. RW2A1]AUC87967.1 acyl-CoA thioesterase [Alteromonas sp. MB-3u-76]MAI65079.1 acyl-CoA thioesterase [Alteromonas sp.]
MAIRNVAFSRTRLTELMVPSYANFGGKVHGGVILSLMDKVAYACASKHAGAYCVTVTVDGVEFLQPVEVGDLLHLDATVHFVGNTSLVVGIKVTTENIKSNDVKHTNNSFFSMVAKDDDGKPVQVPELELTTHQEMRHFVTAIRRSKIRKEAQIKLQRDYDTFIPEEDFALVDKHRGNITFDKNS